jgi:hypothetical protein
MLLFINMKNFCGVQEKKQKRGQAKKAKNPSIVSHTSIEDNNTRFLPAPFFAPFFLKASFSDTLLRHEPVTVLFYSQPVTGMGHLRPLLAGSQRY